MNVKLKLQIKTIDINRHTVQFPKCVELYEKNTGKETKRLALTTSQILLLYNVDVNESLEMPLV